MKTNDKLKTIPSIKTRVLGDVVQWTARMNLVAGGKKLFEESGEVELENKTKHGIDRSLIKAREKGMQAIIQWEKDNNQSFIVLG